MNSSSKSIKLNLLQFNYLFSPLVFLTDQLLFKVQETKSLSLFGSFTTLEEDQERQQLQDQLKSVVLDQVGLGCFLFEPEEQEQIVLW